MEKPVMRMINKYNIAELSLVEYDFILLINLVVLLAEQELVLGLQSIDFQIIMIKGFSQLLTMISLDRHNLNLLTR